MTHSQLEVLLKPLLNTTPANGQPGSIDWTGYHQLEALSSGKFRLLTNYSGRVDHQPLWIYFDINRDGSVTVHDGGFGKSSKLGMTHNPGAGLDYLLGKALGALSCACAQTNNIVVKNATTDDLGQAAWDVESHLHTCEGLLYLDPQRGISQISAQVREV
jgi:hypothetical protein